MTMVYFSADRQEVKQLHRQLSAIGIPSRVRRSPVPRGTSMARAEAELWITNDHDCSRALLYCFEANAGFARRKVASFEFDPWGDLLDF
jgi:hypothetical protein